MAGSATGIISEVSGSDVNLTVFQGKTLSLSFVYGTPPTDVTGWSARMQWRSSVEADTPIADFTVANNRVTVGTTNGLFTFTMTAADSAALKAGTGVYDVEIIKPSGEVIQPFSGNLTIVREITR